MTSVVSSAAVEWSWDWSGRHWTSAVYTSMSHHHARWSLSLIEFYSDYASAVLLLLPWSVQVNSNLKRREHRKELK